MESQKVCVSPCIFPQQDLFSSRIFCPIYFSPLSWNICALNPFPCLKQQTNSVPQKWLSPFYNETRILFLPAFSRLRIFVRSQKIHRYPSASLVIGRYLFRVSLWALARSLDLGFEWFLLTIPCNSRTVIWRSPATLSQYQNIDRHLYLLVERSRVRFT